MPEPVPVCQRGCRSIDDCDSESPAADADNFACDEGVCRYLGCNSAEECTETHRRPMLCRVSPGSDIRSCVVPCVRPADCATPSPAFDEDNYECREGACIFTGCNSDQECAETFDDNHECLRYPGGNLSICLQGCNRAADCDLGMPAHDADNYRCEEGICIYDGCRNDNECAETFRDEAFVCR